MTTRCAQCGEELLGAVNRCWRCGTRVDASLAAAVEPPVRREPPVDATVLDENCVSGDAQAQASPAGPVVSVQEVRAAAAIEAVRNVERAAVVHPPPFSAATGGAIAAVMLGAVSVIVSFFTMAGVVLGGCGLILGVWGCSSNRRRLALVGMGLCCLALLLGTFHVAIAAYTYVYGASPFAPPPGPEMYEFDDGTWVETE